MRFFFTTYVNLPELACCRRSDGGKDWIVRAVNTRGDRPCFSSICRPRSQYYLNTRNRLYLSWFSYRAQDCKNALVKGESYYGTKVKTVGVNSVKMPMRVILHWILNPSLYNPNENVKFTVLFKTLISPASNVVLQRTTMQRYNRSPGWLHFVPTISTRASYLNCVTFFTLTYLTFCPPIVWFYLEYNALLCTNSNVFFSLLHLLLFITRKYAIICVKRRSIVRIYID